MRQPMKMEKIFANDVIDKDLMSKIHKKLLQFNNKKDNPVKNDKTFSQRRHVREKIPNVIKQQQIKTTTRCRCRWTRKATY